MVQATGGGEYWGEYGKQLTARKNNTFIKHISTITLLYHCLYRGS